MKDQDMIAQTPMTQFQSPSGEWSIVGMLLAAVTITGSVIVFIFKLRESAVKTLIEDRQKQVDKLEAVIVKLEATIKEMSLKIDECQNDRALIHGRMAELQLQLTRLQGS